MSVASEKTPDPWKDRQRYRHYGDRRPGEVPLRDKVMFGALAGFGRLCMRVWTDTCRWEIEGDNGLRDDLLFGRGNRIFLMWHNRVAPFFAYLDSIARRRLELKVHAIVSLSNDGEFLARPIREEGAYVIRGSSSREAAKALRTGVAAAMAGSSPCTVGDGPRYRLKPGPILLAKATGLPIVPMTWTCNRVMQLHRSWDQLMLPLPFTRLRLRFGEPFHVAPDADTREIVRARRELEKRLNDMTEWADANTRVAWQLPRPKPGELLKRRKKIDLAGRHFDE